MEVKNHNVECQKIAAADGAALASPVDWVIPRLEAARCEVLRSLVNGGDQMWSGRVFWLMDVAWPAIELQARKRSCAVDPALLKEVIELDGLRRFVEEFAGTLEASKVTDYLHVCGFGPVPTDDGKTCLNFLAKSVLQGLDLSCV
jgi:hypothetical protein